MCIEINSTNCTILIVSFVFFCRHLNNFVNYFIIHIMFWKTNVTVSPDSFQEDSVKMSGWEIYHYNGINALHFNDTMQLPVMKTSTDVLVQVHTTSVNPNDQLMAGLLALRFKLLSAILKLIIQVLICFENVTFQRAMVLNL